MISRTLDPVVEERREQAVPTAVNRSARAPLPETPERRFASKTNNRAAHTTKRSILVVDDQPIVCRGLQEIIDREADLELCAEAGSVAEALRAIETQKPDLVILEISVEGINGLELIKDIKVRYPSLPVLVLSRFDERLYAERALRAGAKGYVTKADTTQRLIDAIHRVLGGQIAVSDQIATRVLRMMIDGHGDDDRMPIERLTDRELEVMHLIGEGLSLREVAGRLHLSVKTVETHRGRIKEKLKLNSSGELLRYAIRCSLDKG